MLVRWMAAALLAVVLGACGGGGDAPEVTSVTLESEPGDPLGMGQRYVYTRANAGIEVAAAVSQETASFSMQLKADEYWWPFSVYMPSGRRFAPGTHEFDTDRSGGALLLWPGRTAPCPGMNGTFTVHGARYEGDALVALDLSFVQRCRDTSSALRGRIRWFANDPTQPAPPVMPPPPVLWRAPAGATPATGNYFYVEQEGAAVADAERLAVYTAANAQLSVHTYERELTVAAHGDGGAAAVFKPMDPLPQIVAGYYGQLLYGGEYYNTARGSIQVRAGAGYCSNPGPAWLVVDDIRRVEGEVVALDLRFERACDGVVARGQFHWRADDSTVPPGPQFPPPPALWSPAPGETPATGNFLFLTRAGASVLHLNPAVGVSPFAPAIAVSTSTFSSATLQWPIGHPRLEAGHYANLNGNPARGQLRVDEFRLRCVGGRGWAVVDEVTYVGDVLASVDFRFESTCSEGVEPLRGRIRWTR